VIVIFYTFAGFGLLLTAHCH